jgi:predicted metal-dependent hydrolase
MIVLALLILANLWLLQQTQQPRELVEVKEKYKVLREHLKETKNEKYRMLHRCIPITGMKRMEGSVGSNTNKGGEIVVCLDGNTNEIFHVLIHELAHCTVKEYSHSQQFWDNYIELRNICVELGIYQQIPDKTKFCGQHIQDK